MIQVFLEIKGAFHAVKDEERHLNGFDHEVQHKTITLKYNFDHLYFGL